MATLGEHIILPFSRDSTSSTAIRSLGREPSLGVFLAAHMTVGMFHVDAVGYTNYQVSFVKRLVGPTHDVGSVDPITRLKAVAVILDFHYGLLLTEYVIQNKKHRLGVTMQPRIITVVQSPIKQLVGPSGRP